MEYNFLISTSLDESKKYLTWAEKKNKKTILIAKLRITVSWPFRAVYFTSEMKNLFKKKNQCDVKYKKFNYNKPYPHTP